MPLDWQIQGQSRFQRKLLNNGPIIVSLVGSDKSEFPVIAKKFSNLNILGFELNLSCPHVEKMGMEIGDDLNLVHDIIRAIKKDTAKPLFVKVGLGKSDIIEVAKVAESAGADGITAINTLRAMKIDIETRCPILENRDRWPFWKCYKASWGSVCV